MKHTSFPYIFILTKKHIKLTKHIWKQSNMYSISQQSSPSSQNKNFFFFLNSEQIEVIKINITAMHDKVMCTFTIANKHYHYLDCFWFYLGFIVFFANNFWGFGNVFSINAVLFGKCIACIHFSKNCFVNSHR